jgi:predicted lipid-binding transport protein (Tim44 family)
MSSAVIQLLVLAGIAIFLILRLRSVLGTREGFEKPPAPLNGPAEPEKRRRRDFEVIEGGIDRDITDNVEDGTPAAKALASMKLSEPGFSISDFLKGARGAYEMILMAFEQGDLDSVRPFIDEEVYNAFASVVEERERQGLIVQANFVGVRDVALVDATFDRDTEMAEITVRFVGELTYVVRDPAGVVVEGDPNAIKRQKDIWTFGRRMGTGDPNWKLVATGG